MIDDLYDRDSKNNTDTGTSSLKSFGNLSLFVSYWSTKTLYHGLWARSIMSRDRFKALLAMLHVVEPCTDNEQDKLRKVFVLEASCILMTGGV
jgi:hypothetical protein